MKAARDGAKRRELAVRARLPRTPELFASPDPRPNAFAVGSPARGAIALSAGLLRRLDVGEIAGVLAHEVAHLAHDDARLTAVARAADRLTRGLSRIGLLVAALSIPLALAGGPMVPPSIVLVLLFAPAVSALAQLALSRARELDADLGAAHLLGSPLPLARARRRMHPAGSTLLDVLPEWLRTHASTDERVRRLLGLATPAISAR